MTSAAVQVGDDYYDSLSSLTFNSRPIIDSLTNLAQENAQAAPEIASAVQKRIQKSIPQQKLYAFYLLDSICKNIGPPYNSLFGATIFKLFTEAYSLVDDPTRVKLIKLFKTWKVPNAITGLPLFDENQVDQIDQFLVRATAGNRPPEQQRQIDMSNAQATKPTLLTEIDELTNLVNSRLLQMPDDSKGRERFQLLQKLRLIIGQPTNIPQQQLDFTKKQLQSIREDEMLRLNQFREKQNGSQGSGFSTNQLQGILGRQPQHQPRQTNQQPDFNNAQALFSMMSSAMGRQQNHQNSRPVQRTPSRSDSLPEVNPLGLKNISFLQDILRKSKAGGTVDSKVDTATPGEVEEAKEGAKPVKDTPEVIISRFELTNEINTHKPTEDEINIIYNMKDNQCSNCSKRFYSNPQGVREKEEHLDWHFRTNKKLKTMSKQIHNRSWFLPDKQWAEFHEDEITGTNDNDVGVELNNRFNTEKPRMTQEDMNRKTVMIPEDSENEIVCGICRDRLVGVFDDDSGEWVWRNATKQKGRVYHYSCWIEAKGGDRDRSPERS